MMIISLSEIGSLRLFPFSSSVRSSFSLSVNSMTELDDELSLSLEDEAELESEGLVSLDVGHLDLRAAIPVARSLEGKLMIE